MHWADETSLRFLAFLGRRLQSAPILVAVSAREEELTNTPQLRRTIEELADELRLVRVTLSPLGRDDTTTLVRLLGRGAEPSAGAARLTALIWEASAGNPFVIVETLRAIGDGVMVDDPGELPLPARVRDMIARRLERLTPRGRELLSAAAVIGHEVDFAVLQRTAGLEGTPAAEGVEELVRRRVLHATGERLEFAHERIRQVAYRGLLAPHRRLLHAAAARAFEALGGRDLESHYGALVAHYREAELWDKAVEYLVRFAETAASRYAHGEAMAVLQRERSLMERLDAPELAGPYYFQLARAYSLLGDRERATENALRSVEATSRTGDDVTRGKAHYVLAREHFWLGEPGRGLEHGRAAVRHLEGRDEPYWLALAYVWTGQSHYLVGEFQAAVEAMDTRATWPRPSATAGCRATSPGERRRSRRPAGSARPRSSCASRP